MKKYLQKKCLRCGILFNTRPHYDKEYCKKCTNTIRMKDVYKSTKCKNRKIYVSGDSKASKREWARRNKNKVKEIVHKYRYNNGGIDKDREWVNNNKKLVNKYKEKNRLKRLSIKKVHTNGEWELLKRKYNYCCARCGISEKELELKYKRKEFKKLHKDHIIPITKWDNVKNKYKYECDDIKNIQPLCVRCNSKKNNKKENKKNGR